MSDDGHQAAEVQQPERRVRSPRPVSTMALEFDSFLDGAFNLGGEIPSLMENVQDRQDSVSKHSRELQELEARLKAMEERLSRVNGGSPSSSRGPQADSEGSARPKSSRSAAPPPPTRAPPPPIPSDGARPPSRAPPSRPTTAGRPPTANCSTAYDHETQPMPEGRDQTSYGVAH